jgi:hypothetical protein
MSTGKSECNPTKSPDIAHLQMQLGQSADALPEEVLLVSPPWRQRAPCASAYELTYSESRIGIMHTTVHHASRSKQQSKQRLQLPDVAEG